MEANHLNRFDNQGRVFCKRFMKVDSLLNIDCNGCSMFRGSYQGEGVECQWNDPRVQPENLGLWYADDPIDEFNEVIAMDIAKSSNHGRITGDFSENFVLYWLSKYGYECMNVDHVGVDLIARKKDQNVTMGISVKSRSRLLGQENTSPFVRRSHVKHLDEVCELFGWIPYFAFVVDITRKTYVFLLSREKFQDIAKDNNDDKETWTFSMTDKAIEQYKHDSDVRVLEFETIGMSNWV